MTTHRTLKQLGLIGLITCSLVANGQTNNSYDRGLLEMDISPVHGDEQFRGIEMFNSLLQLETNKMSSEFERKKILGARLDYVGQANFLLDNVDILKDALAKKNYKDTLKRIDRLGQERFGFQFK